MAHIGNLIQQKMKEKGVSNVELSARLKMVRQNSHSILRRSSMQTGLLQKIGHALNYDFFPHLCAHGPEQMQKQTETLNKQIADLNQELEKAKIEINTLTRIIEAMKK